MTAKSKERQKYMYKSAVFSWSKMNYSKFSLHISWDSLFNITEGFERGEVTPQWRMGGYFLENCTGCAPSNNRISSFSVPGRRLIGNFWIRTAQNNVHMKCTRTLNLTYWKIYRFTRIRIHVRMSNLLQNAQNFTGNAESGSGQIRNFFPGLFRSRYRLIVLDLDSVVYMA